MPPSQAGRRPHPRSRLCGLGNVRRARGPGDCSAAGASLAFRPVLGHLPAEFLPVEAPAPLAVLDRHLLEPAVTMLAAEDRASADPTRLLAQAPGVARVAFGSPGARRPAGAGGQAGEAGLATLAGRASSACRFEDRPGPAGAFRLSRAA